MKFEEFEEHTWEIVEVHYSVSEHKYRAICFNEQRVIVAEELFTNRVSAEMFIAHQLLENMEK